MSVEYVVGEVGFGGNFKPEADFYRAQTAQCGIRIDELEAEVAKLTKDRNVLRRALERCAALSNEVADAKHEALLATAP
jgi:hypothetical protein